MVPSCVLVQHITLNLIPNWSCLPDCGDVLEVLYQCTTYKMDGLVVVVRIIIQHQFLFFLENDIIWSGLWASSAASLPSSLPEAPSSHPITVLEHRVVRNIPEVLIHWQYTSPAGASWKTVSSMQQRFPHFSLEDKRDLKRGSNASTRLVYQCFTHGRFKDIKK